MTKKIITILMILICIGCASTKKTNDKTFKSSDIDFGGKTLNKSIRNEKQKN